jgi:hypothetical protein
MKIRIVGVASVFVFAGAALGFGPETGLTQGASYTYDFRSGSGQQTDATPTVVYDNTNGTVLGGFSSTSLGSSWGDELLMANKGTLSTQKLSIFNSSSSAATLTSATLSINYYRASDASLIGGFSGTVNFSTPLAKGSYSILSFTGLEALATPIVFDTNDVIILQQLTAVSGGATRLGVVYETAANAIGSSPGGDVYIDSSTVGSAGWYNITSPASGNDNWVYQTGVIVPAPASAAVLVFGGVAATRRRRA